MHAHRPTSAVACLTAAGRRLGAAVVFAALAALTLPAAPEAQAQTSHWTLSASVNGGAACTTCRAEEGDSVAITFTITPASGAFAAGPGTFGGTATVDSDYRSSSGGGTVDMRVSNFPSYLSSNDGYSLSATLTILDDDATEGPEADETITLAVPTVALNPGSLTVTRGDPLTITIAANDGHPDETFRDFAISVDNATAFEGDSVVFTVSLNGQAPSTAATVDWAISGAGITAGDYTLSGADTDGRLRFTALGDQTLTFAITDDAVDEGRETLTVTLSNPSRGAAIPAATATASVTIDARTASFSIAVDEAARSEGQTAVFTITLTVAGNAPPGGATVDWAISGAGITAADYTLSGADTDGTLSFTAAGGQTLTFAITDDSAAESAETLTVTLSNPSGGVAIGTATASTTIAASDNAEFSIAVDQATRAEGQTAVFTITLAGDAPPGGATVDWAISGAGITTGDYTLSGDDTDGTLSFTAAGDQTLTFAITEDSVDESAETLTVTLSNPSGAAITTAAASVTIDTRTAFSIAVDEAARNEGQTAVFTITLAGGAPGGSVTVDWAVSGAGITAADYTVSGAGSGSGGTLSFAALGEQTLIFAITDDSAVESAETLTVTLSNPTGGAAIATARAATTIAASGAGAPRFSIAVDHAARAEGQTAVFTITLAGSAPGGSVTVDWAISGAGITAADYTLSGADTDGTLSFPAPGRQFLTFAITDDSAREGLETLAVTLSNPGSGSLTTATAATTIAASDQGRISIGITSSGGDRDADAPGRQVNEGDLISWIFSARPASRSGAVAITVNFGGAYASGDSDFNPVTGHAVSIPLDTGNRSVNQRITDDSILEDAETIIVTVASAPPGWELPSAPAIVTILPSDGTEWYIDSPPAGAVAEGTTLNIVLRQRGLPRQFSTNVSYAVTGSATVSADYAVQDDVPNLPGEFDPATRTHTITAWNHIHHVVIPIRILLDGGADAGETITVALTSGGGLATFDATPRTFTITDTEAAPLRLTGPASVTEAHRDLRYTVSYTPDRLVPAVSIPFTVTGSATRGPGGTSSPLRLPGGRAGQTLRADIIVPLAEGDATVTAEGAETVTVTPAFTLATADYGLNPAPASVTTQVTDAAATVYLDAAASPRAVAEGETVTVFVGQRGPGRSAATTATFTFSGSAAYGSDFEVTARTEAPTLAFDATAATGSVQIPTGALARGEIDLRILSDNFADEPETIVITLTGHTGAAADSPRAFDAAPLTLTITPAAVSVAATAPAGDRDTDSDALDVNEGDTVNFAVTVAGAIPPNADGSPGALEVDWAVTGVESADWSTTASRAGDGGALTFTAAGSQTVAVTVAADNLNEAAETLRFTLTRAGALGAFGERAAEARIAASDPAVYSIAADTGTATEGGAAAFTVTLTKASEAAVTIPLVASGAAAARVVAPPAAVTIAAGRTTAAVSIPIADNDLNQAPQNLRLVVAPESHAGFAKGAAAGAVTRTITLDDGRRADVSVADNDPAAVTLAQASADGDPITAGVQVAEGAAAAFTVTLSPASAGQVTVPYTITGADITADDYADPGSGSLILAAGETTATIAIGIALDGAPEAVETMTVTIGSPTAGSGGGANPGQRQRRAGRVFRPGQRRRRDCRERRRRRNLHHHPQRPRFDRRPHRVLGHHPCHHRRRRLVRRHPRRRPGHIQR